MRRHIARGLVLLLLAVAASAQDLAQQSPRSQYPALLSFDELVTLSGTASPQRELAIRLRTLLNTPFVHNDTISTDVEPLGPSSGGIPPILRVGFWNIERGSNFDLIRSALSDTPEFERLADTQLSMSATQRTRIESQLATLQSSEVLVLNEVDWGMKRTQYRNVARDLATALHMNYAYAVEFVEVDPIFDLGTENPQLSDHAQALRLQQDLAVDRERYLGLHGTAILSRYPIRNATVFQLPVCYDWYGTESRKAAQLEKGKRWAVQRLFAERIAREVRHGGRMALIANLDVPSVPDKEVTIVATHLENRCTPACRHRQMRALLAQIKPIRHPLVMAGDLNTTSRTNTPTSVQNEIMSRVTDYQFWIGQTVSWFNPLGTYQHALLPIRYFHGYNDPTAFHFPVLWNNKERPLFRTIEKFRFADNRSFDFRGDPDRTLNEKGGTLADSNARSRKGYVPTYAFARDYGGLVGQFKLDWIFVKPYIEDPRRANQPWLLAPAFPQTMRELNQSVPGRISDHPPLTVDLQLTRSLPDGK